MCRFPQCVRTHLPEAKAADQDVELLHDADLGVQHLRVNMLKVLYVRSFGWALLRSGGPDIYITCQQIFHAACWASACAQPCHGLYDCQV